jgi:Zn-dependent protease with chaperone function
VLERGSMTARLRDRAQRSLLLGVGVLPGFTRKQLRAVLAHEYGHFSHRDTAGGDVAMVVQASLVRSLIGIAQAGGATFYNPAWHFLRGFHALFLRVTLGASRLQEIMADHFAAVAYGAEAFKEGLTHFVRRSLEFSRNVDVLVNQAQQARRPLANLYESPATPESDDLERAFAERMADKGSPYDSHPPPGQRIAWVSRIPAQPEHATSDDGPAWDLFADRQAIEAEMTAIANGRLRQQGVIPSQ